MSFATFLLGFVSGAGVALFVSFLMRLLKRSAADDLARELEYLGIPSAESLARDVIEAEREQERRGEF